MSCNRLISVVGTSTASDEIYQLAYNVGRLLAEQGAIVVCGGGPGVMEAACKGAASAGGTSIAFLPGREKSEANAFVTIAIPTGMGEMRNALIVRAADAVIAIGGGAGTLSEIGFAAKTGKRVIGLRTLSISLEGQDTRFIETVETQEEAVALALHSQTH